jgi:hypothetical protein
MGFSHQPLGETRRETPGARRVCCYGPPASVDYAHVNPVRSPSRRSAQVGFERRRFTEVFGGVRGDGDERLPLSVEPAVEDDSRQLSLLFQRLVELLFFGAPDNPQHREAEQNERDDRAQRQCK